MNTTLAPAPQQLPLVLVVESDDLFLAHSADAEWFRILRDVDWREWRPVAGEYYEALRVFNEQQAERRGVRPEAPADPETERCAQLRLLAARATEDPTARVLAPPAPPPLEPSAADVSRLRPGVVPPRSAGRRPKCFFAMTRALLGVSLLGRAASAENVHQELVSNPAFARACGFTLPASRAPGLAPEYSCTDVPSLRKVQQFDQLMTESGLWDRLALGAVRTNLESGALPVRGTLVHDTTDHDAHSRRTAVHVPHKEPGRAPRRKSQSRATKRCRCEDRERCGHTWVLADPGAGTVAKAGGAMYWAHKSSTLAFAGGHVLLDAVALTDAALHDSRSVLPHLGRLFERFPQLRDKVTLLLDDAAADDTGLKQRVREQFGVELVTSQNPRGRGDRTTGLPRGVQRIDRKGTLVCLAGVPLDFVGCRHDTGHFLFVAPLLEDGEPVCTGCPLKDACCRPAAARRHVSIAFDELPWIDPALPQLSRTHERIMAQRTVIERVHNLMKWVYGEPRLSTRGTMSVQATLDKVLWAMHVVLAQSHERA